MHTLTLELDDDTAASLQVMAERRGRAPEQLIAELVDALIETPDAAFEAAAERVLAKNQELYRRLA